MNVGSEASRGAGRCGSLQIDGRMGSLVPLTPEGAVGVGPIGRCLLEIFILATKQSCFAGRVLTYKVHTFRRGHGLHYDRPSSKCALLQLSASAA